MPKHHFEIRDENYNGPECALVCDDYPWPAPVIHTIRSDDSIPLLTTIWEQHVLEAHS